MPRCPRSIPDFARALVREGTVQEFSFPSMGTPKSSSPRRALAPWLQTEPLVSGDDPDEREATKREHNAFVRTYRFILQEYENKPRYLPRWNLVDAAMPQGVMRV